MNKILLATAAMAALAVATPASAQGNAIQNGIESIFGGGNGLQARMSNLSTSIQASYQRGDISQTRAGQLQREVAILSEREQAYRVNGLNRDERNIIQGRLEVLEARIERAGYDGYDSNERGERYDDRYGRYDQNGWYDRDGRWINDDRAYGRDGCPPGLARKDNGCQPPGQAMRTGDRYANQYARVPASYGERYRDTDRYLYRYNDGRIYQIERRTGVVLQVTAARR